MSDALQSNGTFSDASASIAKLRLVSGPEVVDEGVQLARQNYGALILAALVPLLPYFGGDIWAYSTNADVGLWPTVLFSAVWASLADAAAARVAMDALEGRALDPLRALRAALRRAWAVVISGLYRAIFGFVGLFVLLVPGLYVFSIYALIPALPVLEPELGAWRALRRSAALTKGARRLAFGTYVVPYAFVVFANSAVSMLGQRVVGSHTGMLLGGIAGSCLSLSLTPFIAAIQVRLYVELRMRNEAFDIEWALGSTPATAAP